MQESDDIPIVLLRSEVIDSEQIKKKYSYVALLPDKKSFEFHVFGSKIIEEDTPRIDVSLVLANDETSAIDFFKGATCMRKPYLAGEGNIDGVYYHYCVPYLTPYYKITDSPIQEYNRWQYYGLIIQKGNLLITVNEKAVEPDRTLINSLIGEITDMIKFQLAKS